MASNEYHQVDQNNVNPVNMDAVKPSWEINIFTSVFLTAFCSFYKILFKEIRNSQLATFFQLKRKTTQKQQH